MSVSQQEADLIRKVDALEVSNKALREALEGIAALIDNKNTASIQVMFRTERIVRAALALDAPVVMSPEDRNDL
jgi:hypothetical protein